MNADAPVYLVTRPGDLPKTKSGKKILTDAVLGELPHTVALCQNGSSTAVALVRTLDLAVLVSGFLNDSVRANQMLGIVPKCGDPSCDKERKHLGINVVAVPCSDCGNIPGVRGNERYRTYLENANLKSLLDKEVKKYESDADTRAEVSPCHGTAGITISYQGPGPSPPDTVYMTMSGVQQTVKSLAGRLLSILDATITSNIQREALKGLVRREVRTQLNRVEEFFKQRPIEISSEEEQITQSL